MKIEIYRDKKREWRWRVKARNGKIIAASSEGYKRKRSLRANITSIFEALEAHIFPPDTVPSW